MKIVHLCLSCFYIDNYSYQENILPKYHVKLGYDVTVIASLVTFNDNGEIQLLRSGSTKYDKHGYKVIRIEYKTDFIIPVNKILRRYKRIYTLLQIEQPNIIFIHGVSFWDIKKVIRYKNNLPDVKIYADSHTDFINSATNFLSKNILHKIIWRHCAKMAESHLITFFGVTPLRCKFLETVYHLKNEKIKLLVMGVDDALIPDNKDQVRRDIRSKLDIENTDFVIITGGKIDRRKNIHFFLEAFSKIHYNNIKVIIIGVILPEMTNLLKPMIERDSRIHFLGWCDSLEVMQLMISSDLAFFPGTHSTLWEQSVGIGLPSVFKYWELMEYINVCNNCLFIRGDNVVEIKSTILSLIFTEKYYQLLEASKIASAEFLYSNISKKSIGIC